MTILEAILQGLIQGFTEFLPVSSSGHLSLFQHFFGLDGEGAMQMTLVLHLGTLVAVVAAFYKKFIILIKEALLMVKDIFTGKFKWKEMNGDRRFIMMLIVSILPLFAFYIFNDFFEMLASDDDIIVEGCAFLYTATILFLSDRCVKGNKTEGEATVPNALTIGIFQCIALVPGISRSGSTISAGIFSGLRRESAVEYSFILGSPIILAGALLEMGDVGTAVDTIGLVPMLVGFVTAAVAGIAAIKLIKWLVAKDRFKIFAYYTFALGIAVLAIGVCEYVYDWRLII